ncbi:hypothetical protein [Vibrio lentus]|uniref:hypothetical protein n=1 Tax=Vibrio lentus TaxID=136468 RepID=UPI000C824FA2|nr:hypothetical protein [Vibrio lentus]PMJ87598.1 hypothetical protein BCU14_05485 [Vibrio lentus]PMN37990.1 hypothetical protein BCT33_25005 [Vibrio lentus]PMN57572.1 hypothetical protein BCT29_25330 [Vibrio lentus]
MTYNIRENCIFEHVDVYETEQELLSYLNKLSAPLGLMIMEFNALEDEIAICLTDAYEMLDQSIDFKVLSKSMYKGKLDSLVKLYRTLCDSNEALQEALSSLEKQLDDSGNFRNQFTHASWLYASPSRGVACSKDKSTYRKFALTDIQKSHNTITRSRAYLIHFHERVQLASKR